MVMGVESKVIVARLWIEEGVMELMTRDDKGFASFLNLRSTLSLK